MAKHSVTEAAKLAGVDRGSLYRLMREGRLSYEKRDGGGRVIETAELERLFGPLQSDSRHESRHGRSASPDLSRDNSGLQHLVEALRQQVATAEADKADLRARLDLMETDKADLRRRLDLAEQERATMLRLLEHQTRQPPPRSWWRRWWGGR